MTDEECRKRNLFRGRISDIKDLVYEKRAQGNSLERRGLNALTNEGNVVQEEIRKLW